MCFLTFSTTLVWKFLTLRRSHGDIIINVHTFSCRWSNIENQRDATITTSWSPRSAQHVSGKLLPIFRSARLFGLRTYQHPCRITSQSSKLYWLECCLILWRWYNQPLCLWSWKYLDHPNPHELPRLDAFLQRLQSLSYAEISHVLWNLEFITKFTKAHS